MFRGILASGWHFGVLAIVALICHDISTIAYMRRRVDVNPVPKAGVGQLFLVVQSHVCTSLHEASLHSIQLFAVSKTLRIFFFQKHPRIDFLLFCSCSPSFFSQTHSIISLLFL